MRVTVRGGQWIEAGPIGLSTKLLPGTGRINVYKSCLHFKHGRL